MATDTMMRVEKKLLKKIGKLRVSKRESYQDVIKRLVRKEAKPKYA